MRKKTFGILCSKSSIFEVLLCHINNFSSFTLLNVLWREFDFSNYLFKFLSIHKSSPMTLSRPIKNSTFLAKISCFWHHFRLLSRNFYLFFFAKFFDYFFAKFSHIFREILAFFSEVSRKFLGKTFFRKNAKFSRYDFFLFRCKPYFRYRSFYNCF